MNPKMVIAGTARGGTNYIRFSLRDLGYDATHEALFSDETTQRPERMDWDGYAGEIEVSGFAWSHLAELRRREIKIVQLVRNPVDVVNSILHRWPNAYGSFTIPGSGYETPHEMVAAWWYAVHSNIALYASAVVRLERVDLDFSTILWELGDGERFTEGKVVAALCQDAKHRSFGNTKPRIDFCDLPPHVQKLALEYGYDS